MPLNKVALRNRFVKEATFLRRFLDAAGSKTKIQHLLHISTHHQLVCLVLLVGAIAGGDIPVSSECIQKLKRSKKFGPIKRQFEYDKDVAELKRGDREKLLRALSKIKSALPELVACLFDKE